MIENSEATQLAKFSNPTLFSTHFSIPQSALDNAGLIDPFVDVDTPLFIDPVLLAKSSNPIIRKQAYAAFRKHFQNMIRLLAISKKEGDAAWKGARRLLDLEEPPENGLGYGGSGRSGSSRPDEIREAILRTAKEIVDLGATDPEMISLMGFFEEKVGPDTISDFTTKAILNQLARITEDFCKAHGVPTYANDVVTKHELPRYRRKGFDDAYLVLVPQDIVRALPIANDWSDIEKAAAQNASIRDKVNQFLSGLIKPTKNDRKKALREAVLQSAATFEQFLEAIKDYAAHYDPNSDALGYYKLKQILRTSFPDLVSLTAYKLKKGPHEVRRVALDALAHFQHHVEKGNLWEELWIGDSPKRERAAQLIFFAIAECFCAANNVDISPEANMGGGPVDFKFSKGYNARVLIEMKRSSGAVKHGYEKQLEIYKDASRTQFGIFVVLDYGDLGSKLRQIEKIRDQRISSGVPASEIVVIDARKKPSASKTKATKNRARKGKA